jgi:gluconokinase
MLFDSETKQCKIVGEPYRTTSSDLTRLDAEEVFYQTLEAGRKVSNGVRVDAIALSSTWHSVMLCDQQMQPLTPVALWSYTGAADICSSLRKDKTYTEEFYHRTGCMVNAIYPFFKLKLFREEGLMSSSVRILGQGSYNTYRLTGEWVVTESMASGTGLMNTKTRHFDPVLLQELGIQEAQLGRMVDYTAQYPLTQEAAGLLGQKAGIPVVPALPDGALNQVGAGALEKGVMTFSVGTSGAMRMAVDKSVIPDEPSLWCYRAPGIYLTGAATSGCCNCSDWYKKSYFNPDMSYREIEKDVCASRDTPVFLPFLFGERCPGWNDARLGGFENLKTNHGPLECYQAILEGVMFNLYQCFELLGKFNGQPKVIKLSGGVLNSPAWEQMCADIFGFPMSVDEVNQGSLTGGAVLGMFALKEISSLTDFQPKKLRMIQPIEENHRMYMKKYERYLSHYRENKQ